MKRLLFVFAVGFVMAVAVSACKSHETCPAYGAVDVDTTEVEIPS